MVDFNGKSRMVNSYNLRGADANMWRFDGYSVFGVSRYTGGDNERVISSEGGNWLFGHHGNLIGRYHFDGWVDQGFASDTKFHLFETLHQVTVNTNPHGLDWGLKVLTEGAVNRVLIIGGFPQQIYSEQCLVG